MQANILITSAGRRVSLLKAFQKELRSRFPGAEVYAADFNPTLAPACHVAHKSFKVPKLNDPSYAEKLLELCILNQVKLVIPTIDTELMLLAENANAFQQHGVQIVISSLDFVRTCRNKRSVHEFFESLLQDPL